MAAFIARHGVERCGFLTLTFADHVLEHPEASRRFNSLASGVLRKRYPDFIRVAERQRSGRIHYHLLVALGCDIRRGVNFDSFGARDYRSAGSALRAEWAFWRTTAPRYRFGRTELLPIRRPEAMGRYVGKYLVKHHAVRDDRDRGARLVSCSRAARVATTQFCWVGGRAAAMRRGVPRLIRRLQADGHMPEGQRPDESMRELFGRQWRWRFRRTILAVGSNEDEPSAWFELALSDEVAVRSEYGEVTRMAWASVRREH